MRRKYAIAFTDAIISKIACYDIAVQRSQTIQATGKEVTNVKTNQTTPEKRLFDLVESLELVTARMLEMSLANTQLATSQTPELRRLFDKWLTCLSSEVARFVGTGEEIDIEATAEKIGLSRASVLSILLALERQGTISVKSVKALPGDGKNRELCDCLMTRQ